MPAATVGKDVDTLALEPRPRRGSRSGCGTRCWSARETIRSQSGGRSSRCIAQTAPAFFGETEVATRCAPMRSDATGTSQGKATTPVVTECRHRCLGPAAPRRHEALARPTGAGGEITTYKVNIVGRTERMAMVGRSA